MIVAALLLGLVLRLQQQQQPLTRRGNCSEDVGFRLSTPRLIMQRQMQGLQVPCARRVSVAECSFSALPIEACKPLGGSGGSGGGSACPELGSKRARAASAGGAPASQPFYTLSASSQKAPPSQPLPVTPPPPAALQAAFGF